MSSKPTNIKIIEKPVVVIENKSLTPEKPKKTKAEKKEAFKKLLSDCGVEIPGFTPTAILAEFLNLDPAAQSAIKACDEIIYSRDTTDEEKENAKTMRSEVFEELKEVYLEKIEKAIEIIKREYAIVVSDTPALVASITSFITLKTLPSVIAVPPAVPNPATVMMEFADKKAEFERECKRIKKSAIECVNAATEIKLDQIQNGTLMAPIEVAIATITTLETAISSIPV